MTTPAEQARALTLEERAQRIIRTLRPTDPGSWAANQVYVMAELTAAHEAGRQAVWDAVKEKALEVKSYDMHTTSKAEILLDWACDQAGMEGAATMVGEDCFGEVSIDFTGITKEQYAHNLNQIELAKRISQKAVDNG